MNQQSHQEKKPLAGVMLKEIKRLRHVAESTNITINGDQPTRLICGDYHHKKKTERYHNQGV